MLGYVKKNESFPFSNDNERSNKIVLDITIE